MSQKSGSKYHYPNPLIPYWSVNIRLWSLSNCKKKKSNQMWGYNSK